RSKAQPVGRSLQKAVRPGLDPWADIGHISRQVRLDGRRKAKARKLARRSRFFELAHLTPRREFAPFLKAEAIEHLGANAKAFGKKFDLQVHALAEKGFGIRAIARVLKVSHTTVLKRSKRRHKGKPPRCRAIVRPTK